MTYLKVVLKIYGFLCQILSPIAPLMVGAIAALWLMFSATADNLDETEVSLDDTERALVLSQEEVARLNTRIEKLESIQVTHLDELSTNEQALCEGLQTLERLTPTSPIPEVLERRTEVSRGPSDESYDVLSEILPNEILKALDPSILTE